MIQQGTYKSKAISLQQVISGQKKTPGFNVCFEVEGQKVYWTGWVTDKTSERTFESLVLCGYDFDKKTFDGSEVEIVIEEESYTDKDGKPKTISKVKWINQIGGSRMSDADMAEIDVAFKGIDIKKELAIAKSKLGVKPKELKNHAPQTDDELPF